MIFQQFFEPGLAIASYLVADESAGEAIVIDPPRDVDPILAFAKQNSVHIRHILETHVHADFVCGSVELKARLEDKPRIYASAYGGDDWTQPFIDEPLSEGDTLQIGRLRFEVHHVPGHTPEHVAYSMFDTHRSEQVPWILFTGDFLFVGDVGRPDLLGDDAKKELAHQLYDSLFRRIESLPDVTEIYPAHGAGSLCGKAIGSRRSSTIGFERQFSDAFQSKPEAQWVAELLEDMPLAPQYFQRMKRINRDGPAVIGPHLPGQRRLNVDDFAGSKCDNCLVVDTRAKEAFAGGHIPDSINIPLGENLSSWAGWVLPPDRPILLVAEDAQQTQQIARDLIRVGIDDLKGFLEGGIDAWEKEGYPMDSLDSLSVQQLDLWRKQEPRLTVLDVRTDSEWNQGHIEDAVHIHGGVLPDRVDELTQDEPIAVVCGSGYRASIAASFLKRQGFQHVANVMGGMSAWKSAMLTTAKPHATSSETSTVS